jgi:hypothetical protein
MMYSGYDIFPYRSELRDSVVNLLQYLWGEDSCANLSYFKWKYEENPYSGAPLGIVALCQGQMVGFRGYFPIRFALCCGNDEFIILFPGDTCVHPDHRRKDLSIIMGNLATETLAPHYRLFFNTSCTRNSMPGYQKMGFLPLVPKFHVSQCSVLGLARYILAAHERKPLEASGITFGKFGNIVVADTPRPEEMASLAMRQHRKIPSIGLYRDEVFFRWRFANPRNKYIFYYRIEEDSATGYVVMGVSPNNQRGYILDYAAKDDSAIREILVYIIKANHFDILSIYDFGLDIALRPILQGLGFKTKGLLRMIEEKLHGEFPLLIRPVKKACAESDFFIDGIDVRKIENWSLMPICSDAA